MGAQSMAPSRCDFECGDGGLAHIDNGSVDFMLHSFKHRLLGYMQRADAQLLVRTAGAAIVNLMQKPTYMSCTKMMPTLLRGSFLCDIKCGIEVLPLQHWLVVGMPVPGLCPEAQVRSCPFTHRLVCGCPPPMPDHVTRGLTGNAMHMAAIGNFFMFGLAATSKDNRTT